MHNKNTQTIPDRNGNTVVVVTRKARKRRITPSDPNTGIAQDSQVQFASLDGFTKQPT